MLGTLGAGHARDIAATIKNMLTRVVGMTRSYSMGRNATYKERAVTIKILIKTKAT